MAEHTPPAGRFSSGGDESFAVQVLRYLDGQATVQDLSELKEALATRPECRTLFVRLCRLHGELSELLAPMRAAATETAPAPARKALRECVEKLSPYARQLIRMRYVDDLSAQDVAERLNRSPNTIYVALSRTYRHLADCVERRLAREGA